MSAVNDQSEAQRVYANAVNDAKAGRDNTQQLARTIYEAGYLEKLDELYLDTGVGGFLDSTATPGPTPWHQQRADVTAAERDRFVETSVSIPSTMILPPGVTTTMNLSGLVLAGLARAATDNETDRVYNNSVDDARKGLGDNRAQASVDEALADFDQAIIDRDAAVTETVTIALPELLQYQQRDDEPEVPTYELYEQGTIWGDRDWHEQGFNPAADPVDDETPPMPTTELDYFVLYGMSQARDEYGDFDFSMDTDFDDSEYSYDPNKSFRDTPYTQQVPTSILGEVRDQKSWGQDNLPNTSSYEPNGGLTPWFEVSPAVDYPDVFTPNGAAAGSSLPVYTPPGTPPPPAPMSFNGPGTLQQAQAGATPVKPSGNDNGQSAAGEDDQSRNLDNPALEAMLSQIQQGESAYTRPFDVEAQPDWQQLAENYSEAEGEIVGLVFRGPVDSDELRLPGTPRVIQIDGRTIVVVNNIERLRHGGFGRSQRYAPGAGALVVEGVTDAEADYYINALRDIARLDAEIDRLHKNAPKSVSDPTLPPGTQDFQALSPRTIWANELRSALEERDQIVKNLEDLGLSDVSMTGIANGITGELKVKEFSGQGIDDGLKAIEAAMTVHSGHEAGLQETTLQDASNFALVGFVVKTSARAGVVVGSRLLQTEVAKRTIAAASGQVVRVSGAAAGNVLKGLKMAPRTGVAPTTTAATGNSIELRRLVEFLRTEGVNSRGIRREIIERGLQSPIGASTPITLARFRRLFPQTIQRGKRFTGRFGDIETRVATLNESLAFERAGLIPQFEFRVAAGGTRKYIDVVGIDPTTQQVVRAVQFVRAVPRADGAFAIDAREATAATVINQALGNNNVLIFVVTGL